MHPRVVQQETKALEKPSSPIETFCSAMKSHTKNRYEQAILYSRFSSTKAADAAVIALQDKQKDPVTISDGASVAGSTATTSALTSALKSTSISATDTTSDLDLGLDLGVPSLPCNQIYRNWHAEDLQRREKQIPSSSSTSTDTTSSNPTTSTNEGGKPTTFLLSYPAEKYNVVRDEDHSPIANPYFNLLGLFFCATAAPITTPPTSTTGDLSLKGKRTASTASTAATTAPVETSPYGKVRFQVPFQDLERTLFPEFRLFFADFYKVKDDWYVQLVVVPSWNWKLENQCRSQGLIELDIEANPFFFRRRLFDEGEGVSSACKQAAKRSFHHHHHHHPSSSRQYPNTNSTTNAITNINTPINNSLNSITNKVDQKYEYRVSSTPKLWTELLIGCDMIPTSELGETVESLLHAKVRKTANTLSIHQERKQLATILEGVALDISQMARSLRQKIVMGEEAKIDGAEGESEGEGEKEERKEMKKLLEITYRLSRERTRLGVLRSFSLKTPLDTIEE
ncbi:hypothetical protein EC991_004491 [Linnemannia zychae]|nr:hypothetical protein EC991_004491 [Linnemannia zychae]